MTPTNFEGATIINKPANMTDLQCGPIYAAHGIDPDGFGCFVTAWQPSYEDLQALNSGEPVYVKSVSARLVPMALFTQNEKGEINQ